MGRREPHQHGTISYTYVQNQQCLRDRQTSLLMWNTNNRLYRNLNYYSSRSFRGTKGFWKLGNKKHIKKARG